MLYIEINFIRIYKMIYFNLNRQIFQKYAILQKNFPNKNYRKRRAIVILIVVLYNTT